ncbi:MAG: polysaccharide biosynthesis protein, partial [Marinilabiliales bacterium]
MTSNFFFKKHTPRWIIFIMDISIVLVSISMAYLLRFNFSIPDNEMWRMFYTIPFVIGARGISFLISRVYSGIVRYTGTRDAEKIVFVVALGSLFFFLTNIITYNFILDKFLIPISIIIIDFLITAFMMISIRVLIKTLYLEFSHSGNEKINTIIFGTSEFALITKRTLERDEGKNYKVVAFVDNTQRNVGQKLEGAPIHNITQLESLLEKKKVTHFIFAKDKIRSKIKTDIIDKCLSKNAKVLSIPPVQKWINGELSFNQIKKVKIEDLLERPEIKLDITKIKQKLQGKTILVTGAAGSIGSEITRQLLGFNPGKVILVDIAESALYDIELEITEKGKANLSEFIIGDITDLEGMEKIFREFNPQCIYHAAAYKHVPRMEKHPEQAVKVNINGTKNIADLAGKYNAEMFVMISTDKAVNPTNIMGASKRIAEMYIQSLGTDCSTNYVTTRFGNVLGSNGSVIPRFRKQIETGGPVTVTHPEISRYFMTIPEACQLVLEASSMGKGGEIFVFDMGKSVKIVDLAKKMIRLSGLEIGKDIQL